MRIDPDTGTAEGGGLFYSENLPPEAVMIAPLLVSSERKSNKSERKDAEEIMRQLNTVMNGRILQLGGDATTGRGLVMCKIVQQGG